MTTASAQESLFQRIWQFWTRRSAQVLFVLYLLLWIGAVPSLAQQKEQWISGQYELNAGMAGASLTTQEPAESKQEAAAESTKGNGIISLAEAAPQLDYAYRNYLKFYGDTNTRQGNLAEQTQPAGSFFGGAGWARQAAANPNANPGSPAASNEGWHVDFTPYLWLSGVHGTAGVGGDEASIHASFGDVLSYLNLGFMATTEVRYNRIVVPVDFMWIKLKDDKALPEEQGPTSAKAAFKQTILTPSVGYRFIDGEKLKADGLFGIRYWHLNSSLNLQPPEYGSFSGIANWVDVLGGGRISAALTPKLSITVIGDAGGGQANSDYEVVGLLGMRVAKKWTLLAGYRYMAVNYRPSSTFVFDTALSGIVIGATWNIK